MCCSGGDLSDTPQMFTPAAPSNLAVVDADLPMRFHKMQGMGRAHKMFAFSYVDYTKQVDQQARDKKTERLGYRG